MFEVEVVEVKEKILPPIDDELAKKYGAENLEKLRAGVRVDLENELKYSQSKAVRGQIVGALLDQVNFDLPETAVAHETRNVVYDIVRENTKRGVARELIEKQKDEIYSARRDEREGTREAGVPGPAHRRAGKNLSFAGGRVAARRSRWRRCIRFRWTSSSRICRNATA